MIIVNIPRNQIGNFAGAMEFDSNTNLRQGSHFPSYQSLYYQKSRFTKLQKSGLLQQISNKLLKIERASLSAGTKKKVFIGDKFSSSLKDVSIFTIE